MTESTFGEFTPGVVVRGPLLPEPVEVITTVPMGESIKLVAKGLRSGQVHEPILSAAQFSQLTVSPTTEPFDGDSVRFRLGVEAERLGLAYEYDPYFALSIARVHPLPHQLEAVYEYFLALPRIRFLLADDPGAGKTIMAGLLLKELKIRGLVQRTLIVAPANLTFQWQREMKDKFREQFDVMRGEILRSQYGQNPWQEKNQVVTSISWISRIEDAKESLLRSRWDLIVVDEAHKMSAYSREKKTLAFQLGEALADRTDHYLLMTATPHKGDPENFRLFLSLLDRDVYGDVKSLEEAMQRHEAPFYLRRTKEALVTFPDENGQVHPLFTNRDVRTAKFDLDGDEYDFYDALTRYVEDQSMKAAASDSPQARALSFTMAMLQRRLASSVYAVRRSLERMRDKREKILEDPEKYRREQIERRLPDDFEDLTEEEQDDIRDQLEGVVVSIDPAALRDEIQRLERLIDQAKSLQARADLSPCHDPGLRLLPSALMREDGNGMSLALPDDFRTPSSVTVSDSSVVAASAAEGWLTLSPLGTGSAEVAILQAAGGDSAVAYVEVRDAVGTFGIDIVVDQPVPFGYGRGMAEAADWWSHLLDGTEWPDREAGCPNADPFGGKVKALADELLVAARIEDLGDRGAAGYAAGCFFPAGDGRDVPALDPGGGYVVTGGVGSQGLFRHEIGHLLGLVSWRSEEGLATSDCEYFTGPHAVEAFRAGGGDPDLPGVPIQTNCGSHWHEDIVDYELMGPLGGWDANSISLGALVDAGYTVDLSKALPWPRGAGADTRTAVEEIRRDIVLGEPRIFVERRPRRPPR